ncbi:hypothetical protein P7C73_g4465, partial [Tremellales sp. Uapishka_1]
MIDHERSHYPLSHTRSDVGPQPYGSGNYWLSVYPHQGARVPALILWFFDSRSFVGKGPTPKQADYHWIDDKTVPGYIKSQARLMRRAWGELPPSLVFTHIPFQVTTYLSKLYVSLPSNSKPSVFDVLGFIRPSQGSHDDDKIDHQGNLHGRYTGLDLRALRQLVALESVLAITSGHEHGNSWCATSNESYIATSNESYNLNMCFNGHSGYGGYTTEHSRVRNGRVFSATLKDRSSVRSWNTYEDGTRNEHVVLGHGYHKEA